MHSNIPPPPLDPTTLQLYNIIKNFASNEELQEYAFSTSLSKHERLLVHGLVKEFGFFSISEGNGNERFTIVYKKRPDGPVVDYKADINEMMKNFVKDYKLPISIVHSPYFEYFIDLYDPVLKTKQKLEWYELFFELHFPFLALIRNTCRFMEVINKERDIGHYSGYLQKSIINAISSTTAYKRFNSPETEKKYIIEPTNKLPTWTSNLYTVENSGKFFFSIDMRSANFTVIHKFDKEIVLGCDTWQQLVQKFTPYQYYYNSKQFRQVTLGHLNTKRLSLLIKWYIKKVLLTLFESKFKNNIYNVLIDEIIIQSSKETFLEDFHELTRIMAPNIEMRIEAFKLVCLHPKKKYFVKEVFPGIPEMTEVKPVFRCVNPPYFAMAFKNYFGMKEIEYDRKFMHEGFLATFDRSVFDVEEKN